MGKTEMLMLANMGRNLETCLGKDLTEKIFDGKDLMTQSSSKQEVAIFVKKVAERIDKLADEKKARCALERCGEDCARENRRVLDMAKKRRARFKSPDDFLRAEQRKPPMGMRIEVNGKTICQVYTPKSFKQPMRCYCALLRGLPEEEKVSLTFCNCSKAFVRKYWEGVLGRPVKIDLLESVVSGAEECRFAVCLE